MIYKQIINNNIKPFYIKCDIYDIKNNINLQKIFIEEIKSKNITINNIDSYIKYIINKWIIFIQDIDQTFIKEYNVSNIIDIFKQINDYIPFYKLIFTINLQLSDDNENININKDYVEYKYKYCKKFNYKIVFPKNNNLNNYQKILINNNKVFKNNFDIKNDFHYRVNQLIKKFILDYDDIHYNCNIIKYKQYYIIKYYLLLLILSIIGLLLFILK